MGKTVRIPLDTPIVGHNVRFEAIIVREPTFSEVIQHGEPYIWVPLENGGAFASETPEVLAVYAKLLVTEPKDQLLLEQAGFKAAVKIRSAIMGFFLPAAEAKEASPK